jgi:hypothetical protein
LPQEGLPTIPAHPSSPGALATGVSEAADLAFELGQSIRGEVRFDSGSRALYAADLSMYRQVPIGVVVPRDLDDVVATVAACRRHGAPILGRGCGTSLAGQCRNVAVVIDFSKYVNHVTELDPERRTAWVEPGVICDQLGDAAEPHQLTLTPDPATHAYCTLGGMIGNNSCGVHSVMGGKTSENTEELEVLTYDGLRLRVGPELMQAFHEFKRLWDPDWKMNPGKLIDANPLTSDLRYGPDYHPRPVHTYFQFPEDRGSFAAGVERCFGVGKCRRLEGGTICPSFKVTREEQHSTRGRTHLLFEMMRGEVLQDGWKDEAVKDALDLCLACKGCKGDCPVAVDVATYKAEFLAHYYEGRSRPRSAYALGLAFHWARLGSYLPTVVNFFSQTPYLSAAVKAQAGLARERRLPPLARSSSGWPPGMMPPGSGSASSACLSRQLGSWLSPCSRWCFSV